MTCTESNETSCARKKLKLEIERSLNNGKYKDLFFEDLYRLWRCEAISPEVVLRELRVLEGLEKPLMKVDGDEPIKFWIGPSNTCKLDGLLNRSASATKHPTRFKRKTSPLNGLWHKHYFVYQADFLEQNIENQKINHKALTLHPLIAMISRVAEGQVTGQWIIYEKENDQHTYLALAKHKDGDQAIFDRLKTACAINPTSG